METLKKSYIKSINPFNNELVKEFEIMSNDQVDQIVDKADEAFKSWKNTSFDERAKIIHKVASIMRDRKQELGKLATLEMGKLLRESIYEVELSANIFDYYADNASKFLSDHPLETELGEAFLSYEPIGVLLSVQPWNFPYYQITRSAASALMAGNTMVLKHASNVPQCAQIMEDIFHEAGLPKGVYTNLFVPGGSVERIVDNPKIKAVALTGSEAAGGSIAAAAGKNIKKSTLELGGSDPFIVLEDVDIDKAVETAILGRMWNAGQVCVSPKRIIVPETIAENFIQKAKTLLASLKVGNPLEDDTVVAPLSSEKAAQDVAGQVEKAVANGAKVELGGKRIDRPGAFLEPTLLTGITAENPIFFEEIFGPVVVIYTYKTIEDAIELANATTFGLGGSVFGNDIPKAKEVARKIDTGMVYINHVTGIAPELPFGGTKRSGYGREQSPAAIYEFVNAKLIRVTSPENLY
ncbi:NAD-dependent succinate-semialdehyde dehydrogenase [Chishuiella sp.]|uniref:NAD-dependent succinate-semialdehyde dehydrogenase n=1 Tax=Chishuiella sp. TaxID=1969467 RepID=UPI0028B0D4DC|nr:NAD-dependent succinate-semialdehyde dehydrogenase [Chishuiella sp.]